MADETLFSERHGHVPEDAEITVREDAPPGLRYMLLEIARDVGLRPGSLRGIICPVLRTPPDPGNWSEYPNVWSEVRSLVDECPWFRVYDVIEALYRYLAADNPAAALEYEERINSYFREAGIGWRLSEGSIVVRGPESFEASIKGAIQALDEAGRQTAKREIHEALRDLSRRPDPDLTGAIQHAMGSLECVARDVTGDPKATLGQIVKHCPTMVPAPLDDAIAKAWGYASDKARHIREGHGPAYEEAELLVGLAASLATYLVRKAVGRTNA